MGKGGYLGGSTVIRAFPKLSGRKGPKKGALELWIEEARDSETPMPNGLHLNPLGGVSRTERKTKSKLSLKGKKKRNKKNVKKGVQAKIPRQKTVDRKPNEPLPEYAELVKALREKYSK